jgi:quinol monooxygenase YgiN
VIIVRATSYIAPESREAYLSMTRDTIEHSRAENGCIAYTCAEDIADPGTFHWFEAWTDAAAFNAHAQAHHHRTYIARLTVGADVQRTRTAEASYLDATELSHDELIALGVDQVALPIPQDAEGRDNLARLGFSDEEISAAAQRS